MWLDLIALVLLVYMIAAGFWRGALVSFLRVFSVVTAYAASFWLGPWVAPAASGWWAVPEVVAQVAAGLAVAVRVRLPDLR